jgi:hypothetical protein
LQVVLSWANVERDLYAWIEPKSESFFSIITEVPKTILETNFFFPFVNLSKDCKIPQRCVTT